MTQDLPNRGAVVGHRSAVVGDLTVEPQAPLFRTPKDEDGGERLGQVADGVGSIGTCRNPGFEVGVAQPSLPDNSAVLDEQTGQAGDLRLLPEQLDVALERRRPEVQRRGTLLAGPHHCRQNGGEEQPGSEGAGDAHRLSLTEGWSG